MKSTNGVETDVLVIGGGIATCMAVIKAKDRPVDVVLLDKASMGRSGNSPLMSGALAPFNPEEDDYGNCLRTASRWRGVNEQDITEQTILETADVACDVCCWGVKFAMRNGKFERHRSVAGSMVLRMVNGGVQGYS